MSLFQLQLLAATMSCSVMATSPISSKMTLSASQQASLAELIQLTIDPTEQEISESHHEWRDTNERACINEIVKNVDDHFTILASYSAVTSLWSTDDGVSDEELSSLSSALKDSLNQQVGDIDQCSPINCTEVDSSCEGNTWGGWPRDKQQMVARQAVNALVRACRKGKSAKFKVKEREKP